MKNFTIIIVLLFLANSLFAQTSTKPFSFQGYAIDSEGKALATTSVTVKFTVYDTGGSGASYSEEDTKTTDAYGVFTAYIGDGAPNDFKKLNFTAKNAYFKMKVEVKKTVSGTYTTIHDDLMAEVPYARFAENGVPVGTIVPFAGPKTKIPDGWLACDGTSYDGSNAAYAQLYNIIGAAWGSSGGTNFNVPDLRGQFLRGVSETLTTDPDKDTRTGNTGGATGNTVGTYQNDIFRTHTHTGTTNTDGAHTHSSNQTHRADNDDNDDPHQYLSPEAFNETTMVIPTTGSSHSHAFTTNATGNSETRPVNAYVYYIIKY